MLPVLFYHELCSCMALAHVFYIIIIIIKQEHDYSEVRQQ